MAVAESTNLEQRSAEAHAKIDAFLAEKRDEIRACSEDLYGHPELSGEEYRSFKKLADVARQYGFEVEEGSGNLPTAFRGDFPLAGSTASGADSPKIAWLAEYDALPEIGHGCGHNFIGTCGTYAAMAAAAALKDDPDANGTVVLIGTPAEETDGGKVDLKREGVFNDIDAAMMVHPADESDAMTVSLALIPVRVRFRGQTSHAAASPWEGRNALDAMIHFFNALDLLKKRFPQRVRIPGVILNGGTRSNVIPDLTEAEFSIRSTTRDEIELVYAEFKKCGEGAAAVTGCTFEYEEFGNRYHEMWTNMPMANRYHQYWKELGGELIRQPHKVFGSIDIGNLSHGFPCIHPRVQTCSTDVSGHTVEFGDATITEHGHRQLIRAAATMARIGVDMILDPAFAAEAKASMANGPLDARNLPPQ